MTVAAPVRSDDMIGSVSVVTGDGTQNERLPLQPEIERQVLTHRHHLTVAHLRDVAGFPRGDRIGPPDFQALHEIAASRGPRSPVMWHPSSC
jgi:hypothetical protein